MIPDEKLRAPWALLSSCRLCPRCCGVDRLAGELGHCRTGANLRVSSAGAHFGEEDVLVGPGGSGTIFIEGCNLDCAYCQNYEISHGTGGEEMTPRELAELMLDLQRRRCGNINFVTPTHVAPQVLEAITIARDHGLTLPTVYNCGGYESLEMIRLLVGAIDIYMPDFKYANAEAGLKYSGVPDYPLVARTALAEMYRQVGPLRLDNNSLATGGVMVRHLVLPMDMADSQQIVETVAEAAPRAGINVMGQYRPSWRADEFPELLSLPHPAEIRRLRLYAAGLGLQRLD